MKLTGASLTHQTVAASWLQISSKPERIALLNISIYADFTNGAICKLERVSKSTVQNIKRKLNTYGGHTISKELAKSGRSRAITEVMAVDLRIYLLYGP